MARKANEQERTTPEAEQTTPETEQAATAPEAEQTAPEADLFANLPDPCVYCGPSVKNVARQYTTYQGGGIPDALRDFIKAPPAARGLITSTGKFAAIRKRLETPGTAEAILYKTVKRGRGRCRL